MALRLSSFSSCPTRGPREARRRLREKKKARAKALACCFLVAPKGFEPSTSALRGRRPKPLDDGATWCAVQYTVKMAGVEGVEPSHTAPETAVLPLDDTPTYCRCVSCCSARRKRRKVYYAYSPMPSSLYFNFFEKLERQRRYIAFIRRFATYDQAVRSPFPNQGPLRVRP